MRRAHHVKKTFEFGKLTYKNSKMEAVTASSPQINFAAPGTVAATQTTTVSHPTAVNLITQDQSKSLTYIVDPSQAQHIQMFGPDQRFVANSVEYNPVTGTLTTSALPNGNPQLTVVSILYYILFQILFENSE